MKNPLSFLHVDRPEMDLEPETLICMMNGFTKKQEKILRTWKKEGILIQDQIGLLLYI